MTKSEFINKLLTLESDAEAFGLVVRLRKGDIDINDWLPIETAPKDKRVLLLFNNPLIDDENVKLRDHIAVGFYAQNLPWIQDRFYSESAITQGELDEPLPTHWQPLPELPGAEK